MLLRSIIGLVSAAFVAAGCATPQLALSPEERRSLRIESVKIEFHKDTELWWGNAEREYLAKVDADPASHPLTAPGRKLKRGEEPMDSATRAQEVMQSPEAKAFMRGKLAAMVQKRVDEQIKPKFSGNRRTILEIEIQSFTIPSAAQRLVLGGTPLFRASTRLKDAATGVELGRRDRFDAAMAGQGVLGVMVEGALGDIEDRLLDNYTIGILKWLQGEG